MKVKYEGIEKNYKVIYKEYPDALCDIPNCPRMFRYIIVFKDGSRLYLCEYHAQNEVDDLTIDEIDYSTP